MALNISRWRNNPATEEHHDNKSNLAKKRTCICQGSSVGRAGKTLIFIRIEKYGVCKYKQEKSYGIVNPRVVGSSPTLGAVVCTTILIVQPLTRILGVSTTTGKTMSVLDNQR